MSSGYDKNEIWLDPEKQFSELRVVETVYASGPDYLLHYVVFDKKTGKAMRTEPAREIHGKTRAELIKKINTALLKRVVEEPE